MAGEANNSAPKANGIGGILTSLVNKGDKSVQLVVAVILIVNTYMTNNNGKGIREADRRLDQLRLSMARQVKSVYDNQNFLFDFVDEVRGSQDRIQTKLGVAHPAFTPYPRQIIPEFQDYIHPYYDTQR